jgi:hypothetical protein
MKTTMSKTKFLLLSLVAVVALSFGAIWLFQFVAGDKPYFGVWGQQRSRTEIEAACRNHVREADVKASQAISRRSAEFSEFIQSRKPGAKPFSKAVISWYGKWRAIKPGVDRLSSYYETYNELSSPTAIIFKKLWGKKTNIEKIQADDPLFDKDTHKIFIAEQFDKHIFSSAELAQAMERSIEAALRDLEAIENELAVALRQEILGRSLQPDEIPIAAEKFSAAIARMVAASKWDAAKTVGSLVASEVASQIGAQVFIRLGVSAGILTTGAANSWWSFGAALVIGIVVDVIWEWIDDPAGDIEREMIRSLDNLSAEASSAIKDEMNQVVAQRSKLWEQVVMEMVP